MLATWILSFPPLSYKSAHWGWFFPPRWLDQLTHYFGVMGTQVSNLHESQGLFSPFQNWLRRERWCALTFLLAVLTPLIWQSLRTAEHLRAKQLWRGKTPPLLNWRSKLQDGPQTHRSRVRTEAKKADLTSSSVHYHFSRSTLRWFLFKWCQTLVCLSFVPGSLKHNQINYTVLMSEN